MNENSVVSENSRAQGQVAVALEFVQGKRRIEHVVEAADALLQRYTQRPGREQRLNTTFELLRRNLCSDVALAVGPVLLHTGGYAENAAEVIGEASTEPEPEPEPSDEAGAGSPSAEKYYDLVTGDGDHGYLRARYTPPGALGLTLAEWNQAINLFALITALGIGGTATCRR